MIWSDRRVGFESVSPIRLQFSKRNGANVEDRAYAFGDLTHNTFLTAVVAHVLIFDNLDGVEGYNLTRTDLRLKLCVAREHDKLFDAASG